MDQLASIKTEFLDYKIAYGKRYAPLSKRDDIDDLAILAHESQSPSLLRLFENLPPLAVLKKRKVEAMLNRDALDAEGKKLT